MNERKLIAEKEITINAYDIDAMGIVSNIVYIRWFEDLRMIFLNEHYPYDEMMKEKISPILLKTESAYKVPLTIFDKPVGRCWMVHSDERRWEMEFEISTSERIHCIGKQSGCFYDLVRKKPTDVPKRLQELFTS